MHKSVLIFAVLLLSFLRTDISAQNSNKGELNLETAINIAIAHNAELEIIRNVIKSREAVKIQNELYDNPELDLTAENIFGSNSFTGFKGSEITVSVSQNILFAGKISKRTKIAEKDITLAEWDYESKRLDVITEIRHAFNKALTTKKLIEKNIELLNISEELITNLKRRVKAGKISTVEVSRAQIILNSLQIDSNKLNGDYDSAIFQLTMLINSPTLSIENIEGELINIENSPEYDSLCSKLENNPNLKRFSNEYDKQKAVIDYEKSKAIPNLKLSAGIKRLNEVNSNTFLFGASIPLPLFNRNQGSILEAKINLDKKTKEYEFIKSKLSLRLNLLYSRFKILQSTIKKIKKKSIPVAEEAFTIIKEGNLLGRFTILDVLDAERTLFEIQNQYLNTLGDLNSVIVDIEAIIANKIN